MASAVVAHEQTPKLTLHHLNSSQSLKVLFALEELNLKYDLKTYPRSKDPSGLPELCEAFPLGNAPILEVDDPTTPTYPKQNVRVESRLILNFLADTYANGAVCSIYFIFLKLPGEFYLLLLCN